jgi:hypothetical protein
MVEAAASVTPVDQNGFIATVLWKFAKTMPDWPHEYTVRSWRPELDDAFTSFCQVIADTGIAEPWPPPPDSPIYNHPYLVVGPYKYWTMGPSGDGHPPQDMTVINRALPNR